MLWCILITCERREVTVRRLVISSHASHHVGISCAHWSRCPHPIATNVVSSSSSSLPCCSYCCLPADRHRHLYRHCLSQRRGVRCSAQAIRPSCSCRQQWGRFLPRLHQRSRQPWAYLPRCWPGFWALLRCQPPHDQVRWNLDSQKLGPRCNFVRLATILYQ